MTKRSLPLSVPRPSPCPHHLPSVSHHSSPGLLHVTLFLSSLLRRLSTLLWDTHTTPSTQLLQLPPTAAYTFHWRLTGAAGSAPASPPRPAPRARPVPPAQLSLYKVPGSATAPDECASKASSLKEGEAGTASPCGVRRETPGGLWTQQRSSSEGTGWSSGRR